MEHAGVKDAFYGSTINPMSKRKSQRIVWVAIGGLGFVIIAIELVAANAAGSGALPWIFASIGLVTVVVAVIRYRALAPRRRALLDN
jgi:hypothetical protein